MALKQAHHGSAWVDWPDAYRSRQAEALAAATEQYAEQIKTIHFSQFVFFIQWHELRDYAKSLNIKLFGDVPIFVALDSADVWANRDQFLLDETGHPEFVAGVPPDYFAEFGQRWGNPLYRWDVLAGRGYEVVAVTGKASEEAYLKDIGARSILLRDDIDFGKRPLEKAEWAGAIDNLGGDYLTWLTRTVRYGGNIASIGLAASHELHTTVMPFILRAVCLLGINSVETPRDLRRAVWARIGGDLRPQRLDRIGHRTIAFDDLPGAFEDYIEGRITGRTVVEIAGE